MLHATFLGEHAAGLHPLAAAQVRLALVSWCETWLARTAAIHRLNEAWLARYDPGIECQSAAIDAAQDALAAALDGVFAGRPGVAARQPSPRTAGPGPFIGRRLSFGSDSGTGARFTPLMYSVVGNLMLNRIDVPPWLEAWLPVCADNGDDRRTTSRRGCLGRWTGARQRELTVPT